MMLPKVRQLWGLLYLCLCLGLAVAGVVKRDVVPAPTTSLEVSASSSDAETSATTATTASSSAGAASSVSTTLATTSSASIPSASATASGASLFNSTLFNNLTIPDGELPYTPVVTPGWGVAGVILLTTGVAYAFVGIKTQWVYSFFSAAYLAALGTTVLIVYVAPLPVSNGVQGGLVVATVCTGLLFGGIAVVFKDIAECLGCLLGGFCFSMWLLTLQAGGLLPDTGAKAALIAAFTIATFALYFSHWTRTYAQISCGSFAGATAAVLGIDCFSRAGLKEFWAYVWALNDNIFPLGTTTYPLTRGIRVELAATVIIFVLGIVSQLRVWRIIQEHRARKETIKAEEEQRKETEEERVGRQVVEANERDLRNWEHVYGDKPRCPPTADSGVGDMESEERMRHGGGATSMTGPSLDEAENEAADRRGPAELPAPADLQMPPSPPPKSVAPAMVISRDAADGTVTVLVAQDDVPNGLVYDSIPGGTGKETSWGAEEGRYGGEKGTARLSDAKRVSKVIVPPPCVAPLPFRVPEALEDDGYREDRSSVATFADEKEEGTITAHNERRQSLAKRLSSGSADLLRRLSQKSKSSRSNAIELSEHPSLSREELVESRQTFRDDNDSIAANLDDLSSNGDVDTIRDDDEARPIEITAELGDKENPMLEQEGSSEASDTREDAEDNQTKTPNPRSLGTETLPLQENEAATPKPAAGLAGEDDGTASPSEVGSTKGSAKKSTRGPKSTVSLESTPASLTKGNLPRPLSRIAMSYRTNEWAKHLSVADTPAPETLTLHEYPEAEEASVEDEAPAPLNVAELQLTAENAAPVPAAPRSASIMANYAAAQSIAQRNSGAPTPPQQQQPASTPSPEPHGRNTSPPGPPLTHQNKAYRSKSGTLKRRTSALQAQAIAEEATGGAASPAYGMEESSSSRSNSVPPSPTAPEFSASPAPASMRAPVPGLVSYNSPQTLLGQRDILLRNKSRTSFIPPTPDPHAVALAGYAMAPAGGDNAGSVYHDPASALARSSPVDMDDLPMSQRRQLMMRQMSHSSLVSGSRPGSGLGIAPGVVIPSRNADNAAFDSHQPQRDWSHVKNGESREAQLRDFRNSVAADLRSGTPQPSGFGAIRPALSGRTSASGFLAGPAEPSVIHDVDHSRSTLLDQKETEAVARELARQERERSESLFQQRMRADPSFQEAHRDAMRRLQGRARE